MAIVPKMRRLRLFNVAQATSNHGSHRRRSSGRLSKNLTRPREAPTGVTLAHVSADTLRVHLSSGAQTTGRARHCFGALQP